MLSCEMGGWEDVGMDSQMNRIDRRTFIQTLVPPSQGDST